MRLPDFLLDDGLIQLKAKMGIPEHVYGTGTGYVVPKGLSPEEKKALESGAGIEVDWEKDLGILINKTIIYKRAERVLIYIRDVHAMGDKATEPKYHLTSCTVIERMRREGRFARYVVAQEPNGEFEIHVWRDNRLSRQKRRLSVCKVCLEEIAFGDFKTRRTKQSRDAFVSQFTPDQFFAQYPKSPHTILPSYSADGAPTDDYTRDFPVIRNDLKNRAGWKCQECGRSLIASGLRIFLHVHHRNGNRWDNSPENLEALCLGCHADKPSHSHMKGSPAYREFKARFPS